MFSPYTDSPRSGIKRKPNSTFSSPLSRSFASPSMTVGTSFMKATLNDTAISETDKFAFPVLVTEALATAERFTDISVKLEPFGYASLVSGRQLLIWRYKSDHCDTKSNVHCRELMLPPSDLAHKADLVHLFLTEESKLPSALVVSPEGHVRYWPNINHEGSSVDAITELQGQECYSLTSIYPLGCILSTTTSSLMIITPTIGDGHPSVICRTLALPQGVLAGIGRKVSSFIFGVVPTQTSEMKQLSRVLSLKIGVDSYMLYVLSSSSLQKWQISQKDKKDITHQLIFEADLDRLLNQAYSEEVYKKDSCLLTGLKIWCLDMQFYQSGVMILTAGTIISNANKSLIYAFGYVETSSETPPQALSSFHVMHFYEVYQESQEEKILNYKFLLPTPHSTTAFIYNSEKILSVQIGPQIELTEVDLKASSNLILGSGVCDGVPLFFTCMGGILSFSSSSKPPSDSRIISSMREVSMRQPELPDSSGNLSANLMKAMCSYFNAEDMEICQQLISEIIPEGDTSNLDATVIALSLSIIDDYPVSDPRWAESVPTGSVSSSLIISYQLDDKLKAFEYMLDFFKAFDLLKKLSTSTIGDVAIPTIVLLCEHAEKLVAAKAIRQFLKNHNDLIENAVRYSLDKRNIEVKNHLTPQDVFFREVSTFHTIFSSLVELEVEELYDDETPSKMLNIVMTINKIFLGLLQAITEYRENNSTSFRLDQKSSLEGVYLPWTGREGNTGIRTQLRKQLSINVENALKLTDSIQTQGVLYQQYVDILDFYLGTFRDQLESIKGEKKVPLKKEYEKERSEFIKPLLDIQQYERAAAIAEEYLDFDTLVQICESTQNGDRMQRYMLQFANQKFTEYVFKWYLDKGQRGKIFDKQLGQKRDLGKFLQDHENLKWLHYIQEEQYELAHSALKELALKEIQYLNKKKTLLSLSKLTCLVSNVPEDTKRHQIEAINLEQDLITHQEALPVSTVEAFGLDPSCMRVFQPEELIEMYITEENAASNAYDFKIALDLLSFMKRPPFDPEVHALRTRIWCKAILKDNWEELDINNPIEAVKETIFFQIFELAFNRGIEMHDFIPELEDLLQSPDLSHLSSSPSFKFLIQAAYEHLMKIID